MYVTLSYRIRNKRANQYSTSLMVLLKSSGYEGAVMHVTELDALLLSNEQPTRFETFWLLA